MLKQTYGIHSSSIGTLALGGKLCGAIDTVSAIKNKCIHFMGNADDNGGLMLWTGVDLLH